MISDPKVVDAIKSGAVGVMPTDTIYGIVASVKFPESLDRIYIAKGRPKNKQMIHLISSIDQLGLLGIYVNQLQEHQLRRVWPAPLSIIFDSDDTLPHSHCGTNTIAVRLPDNKKLRDIIENTGPIVATSANLSGQLTPTSIEDIKNQLPGLDFYIEGRVGQMPSQLAKIYTDGRLEYLERN